MHTNDRRKEFTIDKTYKKCRQASSPSFINEKFIEHHSNWRTIHLIKVFINKESANLKEKLNNNNNSSNNNSNGNNYCSIIVFSSIKRIKTVVLLCSLSLILCLSLASFQNDEKDTNHHKNDDFFLVSKNSQIEIENNIVPITIKTINIARTHSSDDELNKFNETCLCNNVTNIPFTLELLTNCHCIKISSGYFSHGKQQNIQRSGSKKPNSIMKRSLQFNDSILTWHIIFTLIVPYGIIFLLSVIGNSLVIITLTFNRSMRSVTNIFLLNLAIADLLLGVFCMPFTLIGVLLRRFIFGTIMCHLVSYFQAISVAVSVWTLVAMSVERYYAICHPLRSRESRQNRKHAYRMLAIVWAMAILLMSPTAIVSRLQLLPQTEHYKCREAWFSFRYKEAFTIFLDLFLLIVPLIAMIATYSSIAVTLTQNIPINQNTNVKLKNRKWRFRKSQSFSTDTEISATTIFAGHHSDISSFSSINGPNNLSLKHRMNNEKSIQKNFLKTPISNFQKTSKNLSQDTSRMTMDKILSSEPKEILNTGDELTSSEVSSFSPHSLKLNTSSSPSSMLNKKNSARQGSIKVQASLNLSSLKKSSYISSFVPNEKNDNLVPTLRVNSSQCQMQARQRRIVWMLCVVVIEFFICWTPIFIVDTLALYMPQAVYGRSQALSKWIGIDIISACHLLCFCSSCTNPVTYCFMNARFRRHFVSLFRCRKSVSKTLPNSARNQLRQKDSDIEQQNSLFRSSRNSPNMSLHHIHLSELRPSASCAPELSEPKISI